MVSKRRTRKKRGGSKTSSHSPANLPDCTGDHRTGVPDNAPCISNPSIGQTAGYDAGAAIKWTGDHVGGLIKWAGDKIGGIVPSPKPEVIKPGQVESFRGGAKRRKRRKRRKKRTTRKKHKRPKGASAPDITPISREWEVKNDLVQINRFVNDPTIPDREKFGELVHEMRNSGLTDGYFVIDYNSSRSPGYYGKYLISFSEDRDDNLLPDATIYTGGYADNISAYDLEQLRRENRRRQRIAEAEEERRRLEELERQRELEREMAEAEAMDLTLRELRNMRRMERIEKEEERQRELERIMRKEYFENLPENKDVIVIEDPGGEVSLGVKSEKPLTPQNEIPVTRPSFFQRMRSTINTLRRNRRNRLRRRTTTVRPTGMGNKKKRTRHHKRRKHTKKDTKKKRKKQK